MPKSEARRQKSTHYKKKQQRSYNDEAPTPGQQLLPSADSLPEDYNEEAGPADGMQYLYLVRQQAKSIPSVSSVPNPYKSIVRPPQNQANNSNRTHSNSTSSRLALPDQLYLKIFVGRFKELRNKIQAPSFFPSLPETVDEPPPLPRKNDAAHWFRFIHGMNPKEYADSQGIEADAFDSIEEGGDSDYDDVEESEEEEEEEDLLDEMQVWQDASAAVEDGDDDAMNDDTGEDDYWEVDEAEAEEAAVNGSTVQQPPPPLPSSSAVAVNGGSHVGTREPTLSFILTTPDDILVTLLSHIARFILPSTTPLAQQDFNFLPTQPTISQSTPAVPSKTAKQITFTPLLSRWTFALLAKTPAHLSASQISALRELARSCFKILSSYARVQEGNERTVEDTKRAEEEQTACWTTFEAIVECWAQRDLRDELERVLENKGRR